MTMTIIAAIRQVFSPTKYRLIFIIAAVILFNLFVFIPVLTTPGNNLGVQLKIFSFGDYALMVFLSATSALFITMQIYSARFSKKLAVNLGKGGVVGGLGAVFASVLGTASCASCLASLLGALGMGISGTLFFLRYKFYFVAGIVSLLLISLYFISKKINGTCDSCK